MPSEILQTGNRWQVRGEVNLSTVKVLLDASQQLTLSSPTEIDFAEATDIDTAAISLILEWKRRAKNESQQIQVLNMPHNLTSLTQLYGVAEILN